MGTRIRRYIVLAAIFVVLATVVVYVNNQIVVSGPTRRERVIGPGESTHTEDSDASSHSGRRTGGQDAGDVVNSAASSFSTNPPAGLSIMQDMTELVEEELSRYIVDLRHFCPVEAKGFSESSSEEVNRLLRAHNERVQAVRRIHLEGIGLVEEEGKGRWEGPFELEFTREGFKASYARPGETTATINGGIEMYDPDWGQDDVLKYIFLAMAVFDPHDFSAVISTSLPDAKSKAGVSSTDEGVPVYEVRSPTRVLYFSKATGRLMRVSLLALGQDKPYVSVDMGEYLSVRGKEFPGSIRITYHDKQGIEAMGNPWVPHVFELRVSQEDLDISGR